MYYKFFADFSAIKKFHTDETVSNITICNHLFRNCHNYWK